MYKYIDLWNYILRKCVFQYFVIALFNIKYVFRKFRYTIISMHIYNYRKFPRKNLEICEGYISTPLTMQLRPRCIRIQLISIDAWTRTAHRRPVKANEETEIKRRSKDARVLLVMDDGTICRRRERQFFIRATNLIDIT